MKKALLSLLFVFTVVFAQAQRGSYCGNCLINNASADVEAYEAGNQLASTSAADLLTIYPNPATNFFMLKNGDHIREVRVFNLVGREVLRQIHDGKDQEYKVTDLPTGMYLVQLLDNAGDIVAPQRLNKR